MSFSQLSLRWKPSSTLVPSHMFRQTTWRATDTLTIDGQYETAPINQDVNGNEFEIDPTNLSKRARHLNNVINHFWNQWRHKYLLELREAHRSNQKGSTPTSVSVSDIVLLHDDRPRGFWKLARIEKLISERDEQIRGAIIWVPTKDGQTTKLQHPLQLLYPLEIVQQVISVANTSTDSDDGININPPHPEKDAPTKQPAVRRS